MLKKFIVILLLFTVLLAAQEKSKTASLKLTFELIDGKEVVTEAAIVPGAKAAFAAHGRQLKILSDSGDIISSGRVKIDRRIFHDKSDASGKLSGKVSFNSGPVSVVIPWPDEASTIELAGEKNHRVKIHDFISRRSSQTASLPVSEPANYKGYMHQLLHSSSQGKRALDSGVSAPGKVPMAKKIKVPLNISIDNMVKGEEEQVLLNVQAIDNATGKIAKKRSINPFTQPNKTNLKLKPGNYTIKASCKIGSSQLFPKEMIIYDYQPDKETLKLEWDKPNLVKTTVKSSTGEGMQAVISVLESRYTGSTRQFARSQHLTDVNGQIELMLPPDAVTFVVEPLDRLAASSTVVVKKIKAKKKNKSQKMSITLPDNNHVTGNEVKKIWDSGPDNKKMNFIFLSDAYTAGNETFTDTNNNGIWDGDLLLDENGNGDLDSGERYIDRNGNGQFDKPEPFEDTNGDHLCNRFERAEFELTAAMMTAVVMNFEPFKSYSDCINVYSYWTPSTHGAQKMPGFPAPWKNMQTYYETECDRNDYYGDRGKFNLYSTANYTTINRSVNRVLPNSRFYVLLVRDPFNIMVSNSAILQSAADTRGGMVLIHEMGHKVGGLADEYVYGGDSWDEYPNSYDTSSPNLTNNADPQTTKWSHLLMPYIKIPTPEGQDGYGLFEGGSWAKGIYRPTEYSMMRSTSFPFFKVNEEAIIKVLKFYK